jgi:hypothetical protein
VLFASFFFVFVFCLFFYSLFSLFSASAVSFACPISVVKTRVEGNMVTPYRGLLDGLMTIWRVEGVRGEGAHTDDRAWSAPSDGMDWAGPAGHAELTISW